MDGLDLKLERVRLGLRQYRVAQALGIPQSTLWAIESGRKPIRIDEAERIVRAMRDLAAQARWQPSRDRVA